MIGARSLVAIRVASSKDFFRREQLLKIHRKLIHLMANRNCRPLRYVNMIGSSTSWVGGKDEPTATD